MCDVGACVALAMFHITLAVIPASPMYTHPKNDQNKKQLSKIIPCKKELAKWLAL